MNTWDKQFYFGWGYWAGNHPNFNVLVNGDWNPFFWKGFVRGRVDYFMRKVK